MSNNITLIFDVGGNKMTMQCQKTDKIDDVFQRFCTKAQVNLDEVQFYYNSTVWTYKDKTLEQLGLQNYFTFTVVSAKTVVGA